MPLDHISFQSHVGNDQVDEMFLHRALDHSLFHLHHERWTIKPGTILNPIEEAGYPMLATMNDTEQGVFEYADDVLVKAVNYMGSINVFFLTREREQYKPALDFLRNLFPTTDPDEEHKAPVSFWSMGGQGPISLRRQIAVPDWVDVRDNYTTRVQDMMEYALSDEFRPGENGQLILWHGTPGAGKTWAIRSLVWEWRKWCSAHYITDPEAFFGNANYMLQVMLGRDDYDLDDDEGSVDKWKLLIIEDAGELLSKDAKERVGQGLSRLLNTVDGMIGQGMQVLVLITTNEPVKKFHEAVARPGRCAIEREFGRFSQEEAQKWLDAQGVEEEAPSKGTTLAELYNMKKGNTQGRKKELVGFA